MARKVIGLRYSSVDGFSKTTQFSTLKNARKWAHKWIGSDADCGRSYAVSSDGVGKITVRWGTTLAALFAPEAAAPAPASRCDEDDEFDRAPVPTAYGPSQDEDLPF